MKKRLGVLGFLIVLALLLIIGGCAYNVQPTPAPAPPAAAQPQAVSSPSGVVPIPEACRVAVASGQVKTRVTILWSIYTGWMPWPYAAESGIVKQWGDRCNVEITLKQGDYISTIEAYVAGEADGVTMTNMEALDMAAEAGVDTTAVIMGDYSNGNDALITRKKIGICDLTDKEVMLVELSVSHYMLARGVEKECGGSIESNKIRLLNTSDADIASVFLTSNQALATVTWNPMVLQILDQDPGTTRVFDSSEIPGEIMDILFVRSSVLQQHPEVGVALAGAWYETLAQMNARGPERDTALSAMAEKAGDTLETFRQQLDTTYMFWTPDQAAAFIRSADIRITMDYVRQFAFDHGLFGQGGSRSIDTVGILFPNGDTLGDSKNIKLRFDATYMEAVR